MDYSKEYIEKNPTLHLEHSQTKTKEILEVLDKRKFETILDVGCGAGAITLELARTLHSGQVVGIDVSEVMIEKARELDSNNVIKWQQTSIYDFISEKPFDLVVCADIVEHMEDDVRFLKRVSMLGKHVVIRVPLEDSVFNRFLRKFSIYDPWVDTKNRYGHIHHYNEKVLENMFTKCNLKIINSIYKPMPKRSKIIWEMLRLLFLPLSIVSIGFMVRFIGGFKIYLLSSNA